MEKLVVVKLPKGRWLGVAAAAKMLGVKRQTLYMFLAGWQQSLGPARRERLEIVDLTKGGRDRARPALGVKHGAA